jgi:hypothetical protein
MLADEDDGALEKRSPQLPAIEEQLALQEFSFFAHL